VAAHNTTRALQIALNKLIVAFLIESCWTRAAAFTRLDAAGQLVGRLGRRKFVETRRTRYAGSAIGEIAREGWVPLSR
jgi:hypothetical protein